MFYYTLFPQILNMSLIAGVVIVIVLLARLPLKKAPKIFSYTLWAVVLFRLLCPLTFESPVSIVTNTAAITSEQIEAVIPSVTFQTPANIASNRIAGAGNPYNPVYISSEVDGNIVITFIWLFGIATMLIYNLISLLRLERKLVGAVRLRKNIYLCDHVATPLVIGIIHPRIYLPSMLSEHEQEYIILHEQTHIRRLDHIIKIVAFLTLTVHWFNPLVWVAFFLSGKDMEMSCDEAVMKKLGDNVRTEYSASLLSLATGKRIIAGAPLAFGEGDTKSRIENVLNYKKPKLWVVIMSLVSVVALTTLFGCSNAEQNPIVPSEKPTANIAIPSPELPFEDTTNISSAFSEESIDLDESKQTIGLSCDGLDNSSYARSEDTIRVPSETAQKMIISCTWAPASKTVYIGFIDIQLETVYVFSSVGGALHGIVNLSELPDGEYQVVMYSSNNTAIESAVMNYQFQ